MKKSKKNLPYGFPRKKPLWQLKLEAHLGSPKKMFIVIIRLWFKLSVYFFVYFMFLTESTITGGRNKLYSNHYRES